MAQEAAIDIIKHHVLQAEAKVERQQEIVADLAGGELASQAEQLLATLQETLELRRAFLKHLTDTN